MSLLRFIPFLSSRSTAAPSGVAADTDTADTEPADADAAEPEDYSERNMEIIHAEEDGWQPDSPPLFRLKHLNWSIVKLGVLLVLVGVWFAVFMYFAYWYQRGNDYRVSVYSSGAKYCLDDLHIISIGIRRFYQQNNRLPVDLSECEDLITSRIWYGENMFYTARFTEPWIENQYQPRSNIYEDKMYETSYFKVYNTNYISRGDNKRASEIPQPPRRFDVFGLPVIYTIGNSTSANCIRSNDPVPNEIFSYEYYLAILSSTSVPPPTPQSYSLSSLPYQYCLDKSAQYRGRTNYYFYMGLGGLGFIVPIFLYIRKSKNATKPINIVMIIAFFVTSVAVGFLGSFLSQATCYSTSRFNSSGHLPRKVRLQILDEAEQRGDISSQVAAEARDVVERFSK